MAFLPQVYSLTELNNLHKISFSLMHLPVEVITNVSLKQRGLLEKYNYMALRRDKCVFIIICLSFLYRTRRITSVFWELA